MLEVHANLYVGSQDDYDHQVAQLPGWAVVHACKEPYHRQALGYRGRGASATHPEYLLARRGDRLILNMVDVDNPAYFAPAMIDAALDFMAEMLATGKKVLVHCNQGESRGPGVALLYLLHTRILTAATLEEAEVKFRALYPAYAPKPGIRGYIAQNWGKYTG